ncbi:MAG: hypothetical protein N2Z80_06990 [Hydrogenothermaceae bacterium]|nr:hypothetical protein [Hydrogenothermaceae bacterium]
MKNISKDGSYYLVFAHVTLTFDRSGKIIGYQSDRRSIENKEVLRNVIEPLYSKLWEIESSSGIESALSYLNSVVREKGKTEYNHLILSLY